jgi:glucosylceramidase
MSAVSRLSLVAALVVVGTANCGGNAGPGLAGDVCQKASTCGSLTGMTAEQCQANVNQALGAMSSSKRSEAQDALKACVGLTDCSKVGDCINNALTGGGTPGTGGGSAGGAGGGSANGGATGAGGSSGGGSGGSSTGTGGRAEGGSGGKAGAAGGSAPVGGSAGGTSAGGSAGSSQSGDGGQGTGGSAGSAGGATSTAQPEVTTSAQDAYWAKGTVTKVSSGTADLNIDKNTTFQRWDGFGGCFNEMGWDALSVLEAADVANAMKLLYDAKDGANFVYGRVPMGGSDYSMSWYTLDDSAGDYAMDKFSIARDKEKLIPFIQAALKVKSDIRLWASPWVIPAWMMDSGSNVKSDAQTQGAHALYMSRFVEEYAKAGMKIEAIHPQNEPGYGRVHWTQALLINFMKTYLAPKLAERNLAVEVWCGTMSKDPDDTNIALATAKDADAMKVVKGFGVQWNPMNAVATLAPKGSVMQTEHRCGNYNFDGPYWDKGRYSASKPQNDHLYGEESWQLIRDWIVAGVNSYSAWNMVLDTIGKSLDGWPQNSLLVVDRTAKKLIVTPAYYTFRHFSSFTVPGSTRIGITGTGDAYKGVSDKSYNGLNALAFKSPDGTIVAHVYNKGSSAKTTTVGVGTALSQTLYQFDVPAHGWATFRVGP